MTTKLPLTNHKTSNFDIDFDFGSFSEQEIINIFEHNGRCEVKTERNIWETTGNIAIEYRWKGNPSGISTTDADWWIHCLSKDNQNIGMFMFKVKWLKIRIKQMLIDGTATKSMGGDYCSASMILLQIRNIYE